MYEKPLFISVEWDEDAKVWVATSDDVPGLATEENTMENLIQKLKVLIPELMIANGAQARDRLQSYLSEQGIGAALHYPIPLHLQKAYAANGYKPGAYPVCEAAANRILSLPMFPGLDRDSVTTVSNRISAFFREPGPDHHHHHHHP